MTASALSATVTAFVRVLRLGVAAASMAPSLVLAATAGIEPTLAGGAVTDTLRTPADCFQCHAPGADLAKHGIAPEKLFDPVAKVDYRISSEGFLASNHGKLACRICHVVGKEVYPHLEAATGRNFNCLDCHERQVDEEKFDAEKIRSEFEASAHVQKLGDRFTCHSCHDPHVFKLTTPEKKALEIVRDDNAICLQCHDAPERFASLTERRFPLIRVTHGWLHNLELHWSAIRCVRCHTTSGDEFDHQILAGDQAQKSCAVCHRYVIGVTRDLVVDWRGPVILISVLAGLGGRSLLRRVSARKEAS